MKKDPKKSLNVLNPIKTKGLVIIFLEALDQLLKKYWSVSSNISLITTLLDPKFKKLWCFNNTNKQKANSLLIKNIKNIFQIIILLILKIMKIKQKKI